MCQARMSRVQVKHVCQACLSSTHDQATHSALHLIQKLGSRTRKPNQAAHSTLWKPNQRTQPGNTPSSSLDTKLGSQIQTTQRSGNIPSSLLHTKLGSQIQTTQPETATRDRDKPDTANKKSHTWKGKILCGVKCQFAQPACSTSCLIVPRGNPTRQHT